MRTLLILVFLAPVFIGTTSLAADLTALASKLPKCVSSDGQHVTFFRLDNSGIASSHIVSKPWPLGPVTLEPGAYVLFNGQYFEEFRDEVFMFTMAHECGHFQGENLRRMKTNILAQEKKGPRIPDYEAKQSEFDADCWGAQWMKRQGYTREQIISGTRAFGKETKHHPSKERRLENLESCL